MSVLEQTNQDLGDITDLLENKEKLNNIKISATINTPSCSIPSAIFQKKYYDSVIDKISIQNYTLIKTESLQQEFYNQLSKFVKDSKFVTYELGKLDNVITELSNVGSFSESYLKDFNKGISDNYFDFIENYGSMPNENLTAFLNNDFSILENKRRSLPEFDKKIAAKNYISDIAKLFQENYSYISSASFASQSLINLYRNYNYFYPNCISVKINSENISISGVSLEIILDKTRSNYLTFFNQNAIQSYQASSKESRLQILSLHNQIDNTFYTSDFFSEKNKDYFLVKVDGLDDQITNKTSIILDSNVFSSKLLPSYEKINLENYVEEDVLKDKILNYNVVECSLTGKDITRYNYDRFFPEHYQYKPSYKILARKSTEGFVRGISFSTNIESGQYTRDVYESNFTRDGFYNNKSAISKKDEFGEFIIDDNLYTNIDDIFLSNYYFKNNANIFEKSLPFFELIDNKDYKYFKFPMNYSIKNRYLEYKEKYKSLFPILNNRDLNHISIKSSSNGAKLLVKPITNFNERKITLITKKDESFLNKKTYSYKIAINKCINEYLELKVNTNNFYKNIKENFDYIKSFYKNKSDENSLSFLYNSEKGLITKNNNSFLITEIDEEVFLNLDNNSKVEGLNSSINKISKQVSKLKVKNEDIDDFKKKVLNNTVFKNRVSLNKRIFKDISSLFINFSKEFKEDYQTSAFDKLLTSLFCNSDTLHSNLNYEIIKLLIACSVLKNNNIDLNYMSGENNKVDVDNLENILEFKKISKHIFSSKNISYQEKYILESNILGHFLDKTERNAEFLKYYKFFTGLSGSSSRTIWNETNKPSARTYFDTSDTLQDTTPFNNGENTISLSKRICNSIALCFPYNTLNNFGTSKTLDHKRNIPVYYEYGNSIGSSFSKTKKALSGDVLEKIITFSCPDDGSQVLNSLNLPKPIVHRKINTIDSHKNTLSSIESSKFYEDECFTVAMHYLWDKTFDYKDVVLLDGTKIIDIDDFIKYFSKKDELPKFSNTWENLKDTSSYPLHEMFYINRVLKNKFFDNLKNENSIMNKISYFIIDTLNSIKKYEIESINTLEESLNFVNENKDLLSIVFNSLHCYSLIYEEYYNNFIENYFSCIQEIPFIKDSIYDLGTHNEINDPDKSVSFYYNFTTDYTKHLAKVKSSDIETDVTGNFFNVSTEDHSLELIYFQTENNRPNFYSSLAESLFDNTVSINYDHDEKYMFQENASLYFNRNNKISMSSEYKAKPYLDANNYLEKCLDIVDNVVSENIELRLSSVNIYDELDNEHYSKNTMLSMFKDIHASLRKLDLNVGLSFDILIGYTKQLAKFNELIASYKSSILKTENILNEVKSEFDDSEVTVLENMLNDVYRNKVKQNISYLNDYIAHTESSLSIKDKSVEDVINEFDVTYFEKIKYNNLVKYIKEYPANSNKSLVNNDIIILKFDSKLIKSINNSTLIKFVITKTYFNSEENEEHVFYYSPIITHFEFAKEKETIGKIGYIDVEEQDIENAYKVVTREEFIENYRTILNIEENEANEAIANKIFNTYRDSNFCKAALHLCLGTNVKENLHNSDEFISIDTLGFLENIDDFTLNKTFKVDKFPFDEIQAFSDEIYDNVSVDFDNKKNSFIRKHLSFISKINSNMQIQQILSNKNIDDYLIFNLSRSFNEPNDRLINYTIQAEEIF
jgi:hypothetical protein